MKRISIFLLATAIGLFTKAQVVNTNPFPRTISVTGSAESDIVPDEIYVQIDLREYDKKGEGKINLEKIRANFLEACKKAGIPDSLISIASYSGYDNFYWWKKNKKKNPDMQAAISYQVKFNNSKQMDALVELLDDEATQNFFITKTSHSKIADYRKQLKIQAIKAARDKAGYLTEAVDEKLGEAVTIEEPIEMSSMPIPYLANTVANQNMRYKSEDSGTPESSITDFKKINLKYEVKVVFALK
jgi:uncharacterized protein YggE